MKIATWNVNSLNVRLPHVLDWLEQHAPDVLVLQEIKQPTDAFPAETLQDAGYAGIANGQKTYNGVAILAKDTPQDAVLDLPGIDDPQRRIVAATVQGVRIVNVYVPNGQSLDSDKFQYKLNWLAALHEFLQKEQETHDQLIVLGDFNIAPRDADVYDPEKWNNRILCSPPERQALQKILALGFVDVFREFDQEEATFSWWDYRAAGFRRNAGLRIDLILSSANLAARCAASYVDKAPRALERPSDHTPVVAEFKL